MTTYSFIISKRSAEYKVSVDEYGLRVDSLAPHLFDFETNELLARSLRAMGNSLLIMQHQSLDTPLELMLFYMEHGYIVKEHKLKQIALQKKNLIAVE